MISKFTSAVKTGIATTLILIAAQTAKAQVVKTENFDFGAVWPTFELPPGWASGKISPSTDVNNAWDRVNAANGINPVCAPHLASPGMVRFRSGFISTANESGYLVSRPYDLSARGVGVASTYSFWLFRAANTGVDNITSWVNTTNDLNTGAPAQLMETTTFTFSIPRDCNAAPTQPCGTWVQYTFTIPANTWSIQNLYVFIKVQHVPGGVTENVYVDDFSINTYPSPQAVNATMLAYQNAQPIVAPFPNSNNWIIGVNIQMNYEGTQCTPVDTFMFTHNGSTNPGVDVASSGSGGVKLWWTGGTNFFSANNAVFVGQYNGAVFPVPSFGIKPLPAAITSMGGGLHNGDNYFWLTYDVVGSPVIGDLLDADFVYCKLPVCAGGTGLNWFYCGYPALGANGCTMSGGRPIDGSYCIPTYVAGTSWLNGSFTDNDYVRQFRVYNVSGDASFQIMTNDHSDVNPGSFPVGAGYPADPCIPTNTYLSTSIVSPFSPHPPDYSKFNPATVPDLGACNNTATFPAGNCVRTTSFLRSVTNPVYHIDVQCGTWFGSNYIAAFIDFNHDFIFQPGERIFQSTGMNALTTQGGNFTIPAGAYYGNTTMRVREWYAQGNIDGCSPGYYGEVEDYTVTLRPDCSPIYPGWKIWLGYTDDWDVNSNWCGGVPTINDNALIPGKGAASFNRGNGTYHPVIKTVNPASPFIATARKLVILNDTVEINSPIAGALRISDSLSIGVASAINTSAVIVDSSYNSNAVLLNGVNINTNVLPFKQSFKEQKMQLMFLTSELLGQGMIDGDMIDQILIPIRTRNSTQPYNNVTVSMYYATNNATYPFFTGLGWPGVLPGAPTNILAPQATAPVMVFSGVINFVTGLVPAAPLGVAGNYVYTLNLTTPFAFSTASSYPLIVEICYSQGTTSSNDFTWQTSTTGYRTVLQLSNLGVYSVPGCSFTNQAPNGTNLTTRVSSDLRPNLTFKFHRVYQKFPINMETNVIGGTTDGHWMNFGNFVPANSIVTFMGSTANTQLISGTNNTTFNELKINHSGTGNVRQVRPATVNDTLWLTRGRLYLNAQTLTLNLGNTGAITQQAPNGYLQSEDLPPAYGMVNWRMGANLGAHVFPFITADAVGVPIPFTYNATAGTTDLTLGTYRPSNMVAKTPWPTGVTTINSYNNPAISDAPNMVSRYWIQTNAGIAPAASLTFTWANPTEIPANGGNPLVSQRWAGGGMTWDMPSAGQSWPSGSSTLTPGVGVFNTPWTLTRQSEPLPISLLNFTAKPEKDKVRLDWSTASEKNNDYFTVERTSNASSFNFIAEVKSMGPSTSVLNYTTYDNDPQIGLQYYRLKQTDYNGGEVLSKLVPVTFGKDAAFEIVTTVNYNDGSFDVVFNYNSDLPYSYKIVDMLGNIVAVKTDLKAVIGSNIINIKNKLASGVYSIMIQNQDETVTRKIFR